MHPTHAGGLAVALLLGALATAAPSRAQVQSWPTALPNPGDLGVFFDATGTQPVRNGVVAFAPFNFYVIAFDVPGGLAEYELSVQLPAGLIIAGGRQLPPGATDSGAGDDNWIVATAGACLDAAGAFALVSYPTALFLSAPGVDVTLCLAGASPSRFPGNAPGYLACAPVGGLHPFGAAYVGCAIINRSTQPCYPTLDYLTVGVGSAETAAGTAVSLLVRCVPTTIPCMLKDSWAPVPVTYVEMEFSWDPAVATLQGARWPYPGPEAPEVSVTIGTGAATVVLDRPDGLFDPYYAVNLVWLDFMTAVRPGQTPVALDRLVVVRDGVEPPRTEAVAGSIVTGAVPDAHISLGALKARFGAAR